MTAAGMSPAFTEATINKHEHLKAAVGIELDRGSGGRPSSKRTFSRTSLNSGISLAPEEIGKEPPAG
jgi:hypothetical protein